MCFKVDPKIKAWNKTTVYKLLGSHRWRRGRRGGTIYKSPYRPLTVTVWKKGSGKRCSGGPAVDAAGSAEHGIYVYKTLTTARVRQKYYPLVGTTVIAKLEVTKQDFIVAGHAFKHGDTGTRIGYQATYRKVKFVGIVK